MGKLIEEALTRSVIGGFFEVYNTLGFGYKGLELAQQRLDMLVDGKLIVEVKSTFLLHPAHQRQLRSYLQGTRLQVGLLLHFGPEPKFIRVVNSGVPLRDQAPQNEG